MDIGVAVALLQRGAKVTRRGWNGRGQYLHLQDSEWQGRLPYVYLVTVQGDRVPWVASQTDLLADDWEEVGLN